MDHNPVKQIIRSSLVTPALDLDFAGTKELDSRIQFTRTSPATHIGPTGLVEYSPENLILQSESFNTTWIKTGSSLTANATVNPNGDLTAYKLSEDTTENYHKIHQTVSTPLSLNCFSVYVKPAGINQIMISIDDSVYGDTHVVFNLENEGSKYIRNFIGDWGLPHNDKITSVGNGWYRCEISSQRLYGTSVKCSISLYKSYSNYYFGDGTSGVYIWGAQLERTTSARPYLPTTTSAYYGPRFTHDPVTLASRGLLVEMSRANLALWSEDFSNATWGKSESSITSNASAAPDGNLTADKLVESSATNVHNTNQTFAATSGTTYTFSVFLKKEERGFALMALIGAFTTTSIQINLTTGAVSTGTGTPLNATSQSLLNGWFRVAFSLAATSTATATALIYTSPDGVWANRAYTGNGGYGLYIWGAQIEVGTFATSYIPTAGSSVIRTPDLVQMTGTNFSSWYNQTEGTIFYTAAQGFNIPSGQFLYPFAISNSNGSDSISSFTATISNTNRAYVIGANDGSQFTQFSPSGNIGQNNFNMAISYSASAVNAAVNGNAPSSDTTVSEFTPDRLVLGGIANLAASSFFNGTIARFRYYRRSLPAATLQTLSI